MRVLILRPQPGNAATAAKVAAIGCTPVCVPLFEATAVAWRVAEPSAFAAVVMTSANAARHGGKGLAALTQLPLVAVGAATATAARAAGFGDVRTGTGGAAELAAFLTTCRAEQSWREGDVLHLAGTDHVALDVPGVVAVPVYETRACGISPLPAADVALVHSPRAAARLAALSSSRDLHLVAISPAAAAAAGTGWRGVTVAAAPREHAMLASLAAFCDGAAAHG